MGRSWFVLPGRVTFVIDKQGVVRHVFESQFHFARHAEEALAAVRALVAEAAADPAKIDPAGNPDTRPA